MHKPRKHLRRLDRVHVSARAAVFFLTCCTRDRSPTLAHANAVDILTEGWRAASELFGWAVGRYVVMPDHVHFFAAPDSDTSTTLSAFVGNWKSWTRKQIRAAVHPSFEWQREFFDHLLRSDESYDQKWEYVRLNPVRAELVASADEWPYQGEIETLEW